jgi:two-component system sensor histidine kinase PhoQ
MLLSAALVLLLFLGIMGLVLDNAFRLSAEESVSERLLLHIYALIAASDEDVGAQDAAIYLPEELQEPHFNSPGSGLFGLVFSAAGEEIWRSRSAFDVQLDDTARNALLASVEPGVARFGQLPATAGSESLFYMAYPVIWQGESVESRYIYVVLEALTPYQQEINAFRNNLWGWLIAGVIVLVAVQAAIMRWGLQPLVKLEGDLKAIETGEKDYLAGGYPREIAGVTRNLNLLLADERRQRERYRNTLADLAHSLKTPLSILKNEAARPDFDDSTTAALNEQVDRMNDIVGYQLERAVASSSALYRASVPVAPVVDKLVTALVRVYQDKGVVIEPDIQAESFAGDERDLYELLGNLLDNACKYGGGRVELTLREGGERLLIEVNDNGPGIAETDHEQVLRRGARLDTREAGQGIGLAVVAEIVDRYDGKIAIKQARLGGASLQVTL